MAKQGKPRDAVTMKPDDVLSIYNALRDIGITIWIDGGWCIDALLGKQTRDHSDLDIAVARKDAAHLRNFFISSGYQEKKRNDSSEWNYVLIDSQGSQVDVHVFEFDEQGHNIYGIEYPKDSLSGTGSIGNQNVKCIAPEWIFRFKTAYEPEQKDLRDIRALAEEFGFRIPESHASKK